MRGSWCISVGWLAQRVVRDDQCWQSHSSYQSIKQVCRGLILILQGNRPLPTVQEHFILLPRGGWTCCSGDQTIGLAQRAGALWAGVAFPTGINLAHGSDHTWPTQLHWRPRVWFNACVTKMGRAGLLICEGGRLGLWLLTVVDVIAL